ncbi:centrosomal P4.1-associated protein-like [Amphiura filiformis]|uniref:centrosomal P4.1-associated protein-like n=1 Tax=Amphiura filiformis TaxID=82378 RepID=UPI003B227792
MAAQHLLTSSDDVQQLTQPLASTLAWASRAGVLLDPQPLLGSNLTRFESIRGASHQSLIGNQLNRNDDVETNRGGSVISETESNPSVDSFLPLPGVREVPPTLDSCDVETNRGGSVLSETESNPSVDSFLPLPGVREVPPTLIPVQSTEMPTMTGMSQHDTSFDHLEQHQAKEQSRLLDRFKLLKQWQQQQQEKLVRQQQEQLEMLRSEQHRVHQAMMEQRQKQWGAGRVVKSPPRSPSHHHSSSQEMHTSPPRMSGQMSSVPQAIAKGTLSLSQTVGPQVLGTLLSDHSHLQSHMPQGEDLDTASEANSSVMEEGVYPLPDTASEMSDDYYSPKRTRGRDVEDQDTGMEADMEEEDSVDQNTDEFTPEEADYTPLKTSKETDQSPSHLPSQQQTTKPDCDGGNDDATNDELLGDERPIRGGAVNTFEELLEKKLRQEEEKQQKVLQASAQHQPAASPGRKFLRRGQGTARFGKINIKPPRKKSPPKKADEKSLSNNKMTSGGNIPKDTEGGSGSSVKPVEKMNKKQSPQPLSRKVAFIRESVSSHSNIPGARLKSTKPISKSVIGKETLPGPISMATVSQQQDDHHLPTEGVHPDDTIEMSFQMRMNEWQKKAEDEEEDLEEFELLEQAVDDNTSFSSNASLVVNMMKRITTKDSFQQFSVPLGTVSEKSNSLQSSQEQPVISKSHDQSHDHISSSSSDSDNSNLDGTLTGDNQHMPSTMGEHRTLTQQVTKAGSSTEEDSDHVNMRKNQDDRLRTKQEEDEKLNPNFNNSGSNLNYPIARGIVQDESEDSDDDDLGSDSVVEMDREMGNQSDTEMQQKDERMEEEEDEDVHKSSTAAGTSSHALDIDFEDEESWGDLGTAASGDEDSDDSIIVGMPIITSTPPVSSGKGANSHPLDRRKADVLQDDHQLESPPTSKLVSKLFPKLKPVVPKQQVQQEKQQEETLQKTKERPIGDGVQSKLLRDKLAELEDEIERFRKENAMLAKLREEREKGLSSLQAEINEFQKQKTEELQRLQDFKDEEMKKLRREKKNFEKYQKAMRTMPDKKDRTEIELLKNQLSDLQEELNKRESRWQANSARLKTRVDVLEKENTELEEEMEKLLEEKREKLKKEEKKTKSNAAKSRARQLAELESARLASFPALPRVNVSSSSSDNEDEGVMKKSLAHETAKAENDEGIKRTKLPGKSSDGDSSPVRKDGSVRMKSPPQPSRVASLESQDTRESESYEDPASQPRIQRKRSVHFDTGSPNQANPSSLPVQTSNQPSARSDQSPPMPKWNLDHPAVNHEASSPMMRMRQGDAGSNEQDDEEEIHHPDGKVEHIAADGARVITFSNGTRKEISADGEAIVVTFFNGDMKQIMSDKRVVYYYSETGTTHTTYPDGLEILQFPNNQTEKHYPDGTKEITFPDQTIKYLFANGNEESVFADGTVLRVNKNGEKTMEFPNGQREIHTKQYKKREYPDGSVKTVYTDGRQETRYSNGRIRVKDKDGSIIVDKTC